MTTHLKIVTEYQDKEFSLTEPLDISVMEIKHNLSRLLNTPVHSLKLEMDDDELIDEDVLEQLGAVSDGTMEIKLTILITATDSNAAAAAQAVESLKDKDKTVVSEADEPFDMFLAKQPMNRRPKLVYEPSLELVDKDEGKSSMSRYKKKNQYHIVECVTNEGFVKQVKVEIDHMFGEKPFLGGFLHKITKKEYHNATELYLHVFDWPENGLLSVNGLRSEVSGAYFMADFQQQIQVNNTQEGVVLKLPKKPLDQIDTVIVLKITGKLDVERILPRQDEEGVLVLAMDDAHIHNPGYGGRLKLRQDDNSTFFLDGWTDSQSRVDWQVRIDEPGIFDVYIEVAAEEPAGFLLMANDEQKSLTIKPNGGQQTFQAQHIGQLLLPEGESTIRIHPQISLWNPIMLRSVTLKPVEKSL